MKNKRPPDNVPFLPGDGYAVFSSTEPLSSQVARLRALLDEARKRLYASRQRETVLRRVLQEHLQPLIQVSVDGEYARLDALRQAGGLGVSVGDERTLARLAAVLVQDRLKHLMGLRIPDKALLPPDLTSQEPPIQ